jgi:DNA-binding NarL/FixJ family response regulator
MLSSKHLGSNQAPTTYPPFWANPREKERRDTLSSPGSTSPEAHVHVLLAAEHPEMRWALRTALSQEHGLTVVGEVSSVHSLLSVSRTVRPDLILVEWELPGHPVEALLTALHVQGQRARLVVIAREPQAREAALEAGADAFLSKAEPPAQFLEELRALLRR